MLVFNVIVRAPHFIERQRLLNKDFYFSVIDQLADLRELVAIRLGDERLALCMMTGRFDL
jgi:hypothetical protein